MLCCLGDYCANTEWIKLNPDTRSTFLPDCLAGSHLDFQELTPRKIFKTGLTGIRDEAELESLEDLELDPLELAAIRIHFRG